MAETIISPGVYLSETNRSFIAPPAIEAGAAFIGPTVKGPVQIPIVVTSYNDYVRTFGVTQKIGNDNKEFLTSLAVKNYFQQGGETALITRVVSGSYTSAQSTYISSVSGSEQPFVLQTIGKGVIYNNALTSASISQNSDGSLVSGSEDNLRWEISNINTSLGTFTLSVRRGDDSTTSKIVLETFNNLSLDPNSDNYIEKVVGNQTYTLSNDADGYYIAVSGDYVNRSSYIRVSQVNHKLINYLSTDGTTVNTGTFGGDTDSYNAFLPTAASGAFYNATGQAQADGLFFNSISNTNTQGLNASDYSNVISLLENREEYKFNVITAPGLIYANATHVTPLDSLISLAETRGDCIAVVDLQNYGSTISNVVAQAVSLNSSYAASYWPWVQMKSAVGKDIWAPASTVIPGVYAFTDSSSAPWYAPAGFIRGGLVGVIQVERKLTQAQRGTLYSGKVNPIGTFPGSGTVIFGQKTLQTKASALDRVNVRRLLIELKDFIGSQANNLIFEQNTIATRNRFLSIVNPYLDRVVQRQGLYAYTVKMDDQNNTADVIDRNQIVGQIIIQPTKTIEFVLLDFTIEPTGVSF